MPAVRIQIIYRFVILKENLRETREIANSGDRTKILSSEQKEQNVIKKNVQGRK